MRVILITERRLEELIEASWQKLNRHAHWYQRKHPVASEMFREVDLELHELRRKICEANERSVLGIGD